MRHCTTNHKSMLHSSSHIHSFQPYQPVPLTSNYGRRIVQVEPCWFGVKLDDAFGGLGRLSSISEFDLNRQPVLPWHAMVMLSETGPPFLGPSGAQVPPPSASAPAHHFRGALRLRMIVS
jgi:hypothetical protein